MLQELGHVGVTHSSDEQNVLIHLAKQSTRTAQYSTAQHPRATISSTTRRLQITRITMHTKRTECSATNLGLLALQLAGSHQHTLHGTHAKVVVVLLGQLLTGQLVQLHHLVGQGQGVGEALGEQNDLCDQAVVGHHHRYGAEQGL